MLLPSSRWEECPPIPTYSLVRRKRLPGKCTVGGAYPLLPSYHTPLSSLFQCWKRNSGSKVRYAPTRLHMQNIHTQLPWKMGLSRKEAGQEHRLGHGGLLRSPRARAQDTHVRNTQTPAHLCTRGWALRDGLGSQLWGDGEAIQETLQWGRWGNLYTWVTDVGYAQIKKQISNSPKFLSVRWRLLATRRRSCRSTRAAFHVELCESVRT